MFVLSQLKNYEKCVNCDDNNKGTQRFLINILKCLIDIFEGTDGEITYLL